MMRFKRNEQSGVHYRQKDSIASDTVAKATEVIARICKRFESEINSRTKSSGITFTLSLAGTENTETCEFFEYIENDNAPKIVAMVNEAGARIQESFTALANAAQDCLIHVTYHNEYE